MALFCAHCCFYHISTGESVLTFSSFWGICWHIQWTIPSLCPPFSQRLHSSFVLLLFALLWTYLLAGLCRFIELLIFSILALGRKVHASYFQRFGKDLHVYFNRLLESSHPIFKTNQTFYFICFTTSSIFWDVKANPVGKIVLSEFTQSLYPPKR